MTHDLAASYDPEASYPLLRTTLALVAERCKRPCPLPLRPTRDALARMESAENELTELTPDERRMLAYSGALDASTEADDHFARDINRIEAAALVADGLLDDVFEQPETLEKP